MEFGAEIEVDPRQIAEPEDLVVIDCAGDGDDGGLEIFEGEIVVDLGDKFAVELLLVVVAGEADRVENFAIVIDESNEGFGAADVNTEIHIVSLALKMMFFGIFIGAGQCYSGSSKRSHMEKANFKKWGWWALGGVVAVVVIAVVVAVVGSGPEPIDNADPEDGSTEVADNTPVDTKEPDGAETKEPEALPQSGPVEDGMPGLLLAGVFAYVMGLALTSMYRAAKHER